MAIDRHRLSTAVSKAGEEDRSPDIQILNGLAVDRNPVNLAVSIAPPARLDTRLHKAARGRTSRLRARLATVAHVASGAAVAPMPGTLPPAGRGADTLNPLAPLTSPPGFADSAKAATWAESGDRGEVWGRMTRRPGFA